MQGGLWRSAAEWIWSWAQEHPSVQAGIVKVFKRPRLVLTLPANDGYCSQVVMVPAKQPGTTQLARYVRTNIENTGRSQAIGVRLYIDSLTVNGQPAIARDLSNVLSLKDHDTFEPFDLPRHIPGYVNVCAAVNDESRITFLTRASLRGAHTYSAQGEYVVVIRAEGENFVSLGEICLRIFFDPVQPLNTRAELVSERTDMRIA